MSSVDATFQRCQAEFTSVSPTTPQQLQNRRRWVADAESLLASGSPQYPAGVIASPPAFNTFKMRRLIDSSHCDVRDRLYELFKQPVFHICFGETLEQERAHLIQRWHAIVQTGVFNNTISSRTAEGRRKYEAITESVGVLDHSLDIKMSVHYGLFGATIGLMGDDEQAAMWLPKIESCEMLGCFALTELGYGSNARGIQTEAIYDAKTQTFILNTPCEEAQKYWIGGAFRTARWTTAFAQLVVSGVCHGIHPFLVRIRNEDGTPAPGVTLADCGHKCGLNGVDNGRIWFDNVRLPHVQMLRKFSQVSLDGVYSSKFKTADERFGASLASLSAGRISVASGCLNQAKLGLAIAIRYALSRKAFGPQRGPEIRLMDYPSHQHRLIPRLASSFVLQLVLNQLKQKWHRQEFGKELHVWSSGFKAMITWFSLTTLQEAREACGGQGYKSENRIGPIKNSHDVALTYEGDNHILMQAVTKSILPEFLRGFKTGGKFEGHFAYLNDRSALRNVDLSSANPCSALYGLTAMRRREATIFAKLASEIQEKVRKGMSSLDAFNHSMISVEEAARAHTELLIVEVFNKVYSEIRQKGETEIADMLSLCGGLFVVWQIDQQPIFLRNGAVSPRDAERAHQLVMDISGQLRPHVLHLVDSFGFPPHLLAPIAFDYVSHNDRCRL